MVYKRAQYLSIGMGEISGVPDTFGLEVTGVYNLFDHRYLWGYCCRNPGHHGTATELGQFVDTGAPSPGGQEGVSGGWDGPEGAVWREIGTPQRTLRQQGCHEYLVGDPNRIALYRGGD